MLIEFTVGNFRSFKDPVTLSMVAANLVSKDKALDEENTIQVDDDLRLLTSAAIYGANASGKSNLAAALRFMQGFVLNSSRETQAEDRIGVERFRLSTETEGQPSHFEIIFLLDGKKYRYGFEVTTERVVAEWLFFVPTSREANLFERKLDDIKVSTRHFKEGRGIEERTRPNALFLSVVAQFNGEIAQRILTWFRRFNVNLGISDDFDLRFAGELFHEIKSRTGIIHKSTILGFIKDLDLGINDIRSERVTTPWHPGSEEAKALLESISSLLVNLPAEEITRIRTVHQKYDSKGNPVGSEIFDLIDQESAGTQRLFSLALPILIALRVGRRLFIDELDARLHPLITQAIIGLFNSKKSNPNNAQLIFTTHDTNLLSNKLFRRDQIWFVEKDRFGASHLYSLAEFRVRNDASFERDYIEGRYGAIPFIQSDPQLVAAGEHGEE
jgi:AAA15 family ATPase/GTPase